MFVPSLDEEIFHFYFADYVLYLVSYIVQFVSECVRRSVPASQVIETGLEIMDIDYLETVYLLVVPSYMQLIRSQNYTRRTKVGKILEESFMRD